MIIFGLLNYSTNKKLNFSTFESFLRRSFITRRKIGLLVIIRLFLELDIFPLVLFIQYKMQPIVLI